MKLFIVVNNGAALPAGTIVRKFDEGFAEVMYEGEGTTRKITGQCKELLFTHESLMPFVLPYNFKGQFELYDGQAFHRGSPDGTVQGAIAEAVFNNRGADDLDWTDELEDNL